MTRLLSVCSLVVLFTPSASIFGQTSANPAAGPRSGPPQGTASAPTQPQAAAPAKQVGGSYGPQPVAAQGQPSVGPGPIRPVGGQQSAGQPQAPTAADAIPAPSPGGPIANPPAIPQQPDWVARLTGAEQEWIEKMLRFWEARSDKIKLFECKFQRWDYDPVFGPPDRNKAKTIAEGVIKYAQPEKGLYRVERLLSYVAPSKPGEQEYFEQDPTFGEHWICDGERVFEFDARNKRLIERPLPPEMRGRAIADGPLPFMFGAKAETIKARYWIHRWPDGGADKYWLEAVPKSRQDAQNFSRVIIALDEKEFLPEILQVFAPNFNPQTNPSKQTYAFKDRKMTDQQGLAGLNPLNFFKPDDFRPKVPAGWQKVLQDDVGGGSAPPLQSTGPASPPRQLAPLTR